AAGHRSPHSRLRFPISVLPPLDVGTMWSHSPSSVTRPQAWQVYWSLRLTASTRRRHGLPPRPLPQRSGFSRIPVDITPAATTLYARSSELLRDALEAEP